MLRFAEDVTCRLFRLETALVLHHAAQWAELGGAIVHVRHFGNGTGGAEAIWTWDLAVALDMDRAGGAGLRQLSGYLSRNLGPQYAISLTDGRVVVEWDARRGGAAGAAPPTAANSKGV